MIIKYWLCCLLAFAAMQASPLALSQSTGASVGALSPEAHHKALELTRTIAAEVEYWPTPDPTAVEGTREQRLAAYREVRDQLAERIKNRFGWQPGGNE